MQRTIMMAKATLRCTTIVRINQCNQHCILMVFEQACASICCGRWLS